MTSIHNFELLGATLRQQGVRKRVAVVCPSDSETLGAILMALKGNMADVICVGSSPSVEAYGPFNPYREHITMVPSDSDAAAAAAAVKLIRDGNADILMKGHLNTDVLLRAVLDKEHGILPKGRVMTHLAVADIPAYHKLLFFTDVAVIPVPTHEQRIQQVKYLVDLCHAFGIEEPKVSLIHCSEKVDERHFPVTGSYVQIKEMAEKGEFGRCIVDGPLDVKTSCSADAMRLKGLHSPIDGDADALVMPGIEAGNAFYKTITLFSQAQMACLLEGPIAPVVITSRGDSALSKFYSLELAIIKLR